MELCSLVAVAAAGSMVRAAGCCAHGWRQWMVGAAGRLLRPYRRCGPGDAALTTRPALAVGLGSEDDGVANLPEVKLIT